MLKGINQWCYPAETSLVDVFSYSKEAGFDAVELNLYDKDGIGLTMETSSREAERVLSLAERHALKLRSLSTALLWEAPLSSNDESVRERGRDIVKNQIDLANLMGMDTVLVVPGLVDEKVSYEDCYRNSQEEVKRLAEYAETKGVHIGIENVWNKFLLSPLEMKKYVEEVESDFVGVYFDVGNVLQFGYPEQWIRILGTLIRKVHVKDFNTKIGNMTGFVPLLTGDVNWQAVMEALHETGYDDVITAELTPYDVSVNQLAVDTAGHMDVLFGLSSKAQNV
ncbi:sugar phosphate isomerase/epimerase family protein [Fictibacillus phosphorivorans]|uniref:sugar phosphate isomerase/epimerase family protein n=1 Tax=Fictibacillus phosphorivorans TaxID=1221500 RepID=UPI00203F61D8|nr:sugar phosphate isomerase/epimerase family protein [Fictibacillus phosphorivorans]MCM3717723.1 sugar phosphate isomerase/epimerase [Fictibacillus phosphorivorans]MCM3775623.1 sugar phosphate isomerase/epimerase [Fictibacillus phosphorivorans]